jgi:hypothetical protein
MQHVFETKKLTMAVVDRETAKHIRISFAEGSDRSGYLTINSSNTASPDYIKISFHRASNELRYAFTNEYWRDRGKPNQERKKFVANASHSNQILAFVYLDKSALFRTDGISPSCKTILFPRQGVVELALRLGKTRLTLSSRGIKKNFGVQELIHKTRNQIYKSLPNMRGAINGCVQILLSGETLPLRIVVCGV